MALDRDPVAVTYRQILQERLVHVKAARDGRDAGLAERADLVGGLVCLASCLNKAVTSCRACNNASGRKSERASVIHSNPTDRVCAVRVRAWHHVAD